MGLFSRLGTLIKSNLNDLISRAEDPEKMLNQVLTDMGNQLVDAKRQIAASIADEKRLRKQADNEGQTAREWERKAMMAVRAGDDELAKQALLRQKEHETTAAQFEEQWKSQKVAVDRLKETLRTLNDKVEEAKRKKNILIARKKRAEAQKAIQETMSGLSDKSAFDTFDRMSDKIEHLEAEAEAGTELAGELGAGDSLAQKFKQLGTTAGADLALAELKAKMGLEPASSAPQAALPAGQQQRDEGEAREKVAAPVAGKERE